MEVKNISANMFRRLALLVIQICRSAPFFAPSRKRLTVLVGEVGSTGDNSTPVTALCSLVLSQHQTQVAGLVGTSVVADETAPGNQSVLLPAHPNIFQNIQTAGKQGMV